MLDDENAPGLTLIGGAGLESLAPPLIESVRARRDPFERIVVAVPNREVQVFAQDTIARALGVCMHVEMTTIERAVTAHASSVGVPLRVWSARSLARAMLFVIDEARESDDALWRSVRPLIEAVAPTSDGRGHSDDDVHVTATRLSAARATRFALHMAHLFLAAHATHPLDVVELTRPPDAVGAPFDWRRALLSRAAHLTGAKVRHAFSSEIARALDEREGSLPLIVFGHASLSPLERDLLQVVARRARVRCIHDGVVRAGMPLHADSFLARATALARETRGALVEIASEVVLVDDRAQARARARPLDGLMAALGHPPGAPVDEALRERVRIVGAPGPGREAEIVAGAIWDHVRTHPDVRFTDVNVASARYEHQIAWLEDRFARFHGLRLTTPPGGRASRLLDVATGLLDLAESGFTRDRVLDVLTHPCSRASDVLEDAGERARDAGIFLGRDGDDDELQYLGGAPRFHWEQGLARLAFSTWLTAPSTIGDAPLALPSIELPPGAQESARALHGWATSLLADLQALRGVQLPGALWARAFEDLFRTTLAPRDSKDGAHWAALLGATRAIADVDDAVPPLEGERRGPIAIGAGEGTPIAFASAVALLKDGLAAGGGRKGHFGADGVAISRLHENRGVPFSLVVVSGMDERAFPGRDVVDPLDPRVAWGTPPSTRAVRALAFVQTVLAARDALVVTFDGHDPTRDAVLSPSPLVEDLAHALGDVVVLRASLDAHEPSDARVSTLAHDEGARRRSDARALREALFPALADVGGAVDTGVRAWQRALEDDGLRARAGVSVVERAPLRAASHGVRRFTLFSFTDALKDDVSARAAGRGLSGFGGVPDEERAVSHEPFSVDERAAHHLARQTIPALLVESPREKPSGTHIADAVDRALAQADARGELPFGPLRAPDVRGKVLFHVEQTCEALSDAGAFARGFDAVVTLGPPKRDTVGRRARPLLVLPTSPGEAPVVVQHERGLLFGPPDDRLLVELSGSRSPADGDREFRQRMEILLFVAAGEILPGTRVATHVVGLGRVAKGTFAAPSVDAATQFLLTLAAIRDEPLDAPLFPLRDVGRLLAPLLDALDDDDDATPGRERLMDAVLDAIARPEPDDDVNLRLRMSAFGPAPVLRSRDGFRLPTPDEVVSLARTRFGLLHRMARP